MKKVILCLLLMVFVLMGCQRECDHTYTMEITQAESCTQTGIALYTCSGCGDSYTKTIPATEHVFGDDEVDKAATCTEEGLMKAVCTICGFTRETQIEKTPHTFGEAVVTKEPNCTEEGETTATCVVCGVSQVQEVLPTNGQHIFTHTVVKEANCIDHGKGVNTCTLCQYSEECEYELKDHTYVSKITKKATCTEKGSKTITCSICSKTKTEKIAALGHDYTTISEENRPSTYASKCVRQCKTCGIEKTLYRVGNNEIDLNEVQNELEEYAQDYGFKTTDSFEDLPYYQQVEHIGMEVWRVAGSGGLDDLIQQAKYRIDYQYSLKKNATSGLGQFLMHLSISYGESGAMGGGSFSFRLTVTDYTPESETP